MTEGHSSAVNIASEVFRITDTNIQSLISIFFLTLEYCITETLYLIYTCIYAHL